MSWFNHKGVWIRVRDGGPAEVQGQLREAISDLQQLKDFNPHEVKTMIRPGKWRITSIHGRDVIEMEVGPGPAPKKKPTIRYDPLTSYVPAFHAYDDTHTLVGIVVCLAGKWGPPYKFIACTEEELLDFEWGLWNWDYRNEPPPEDENVETLITVQYEGAPIVPEEGQPLPDKHYFDVPAAHSYTGTATQVDYQVGGAGSTLTGTDIIRVQCDQNEAHVYLKGFFNWEDWWYYTHALCVINDWDVYEDELPQLRTWVHGYARTGTYAAHGNASSAYVETPPPSACDMALSNLEGEQSWENVENYFRSATGLNTRTTWWEDWNVTNNGYGQQPYTSSDWCTFDSVEHSDGVYFLGLSEYAQYYQNLFMDGYTTPGTFYNFTGTEVVTTNAVYTSADYIVVFGDPYLLKTHDNFYGYTGGYGNELHYCNPRAYKLGSEGNGAPRWCLASAIRHDYQSWEYMCFQPDAEPAVIQYNDPVATFDVVDPTYPNYWHELPIEGSVDGQTKQLYGNGHFSLIRIYEPHGLVYRGEEPDAT